MSVSFKVALGQLATELGNVEANLNKIESQCDEAIREGADLILFPELALSGYSVGELFHQVSTTLESPHIERLKLLSKRIDICTGILEETPDIDFYNSSIYLSGGEILPSAPEIYLPTYGRFDERRWFGQGRDVSAFDTRFGRMAMLICGDCWHLPMAYLAVHDGADVLLVMAASSRQGLAQTVHPQTAWNSMNHSTALTMNSFVLFSNRAGEEKDLQFWGGSQVILPDGSVQKEGKLDHEDLVLGEVDMSLLRRQRIILPFRRDDDLELTLRMGKEDLTAQRDETKSLHEEVNLTRTRGETL